MPLIDRIEVHEATGGRTIYRQQNIDIHFNFIGNYYPPVETISEEERTAAIEAEQLRKKKEKKSGVRNAGSRSWRNCGTPPKPGTRKPLPDIRSFWRSRKSVADDTARIKGSQRSRPGAYPADGRKERREQEKMLEAERKRVERASRKKKLTRAELKEKAETDPAAAKEMGNHESQGSRSQTAEKRA